MVRAAVQLSCLTLLASAVVATDKTFKLDFTREKRTVPLARRQSSPSGALNIALTETQEQNGYFVKLSVGTPPQAFKLTLDTGSSDLWVPAVDDTACTDGNNACVFGTFDSSASSTYQLVAQGGFSISYGDGSQNQGDYFSDVVTIGGQSLSNVTIGLAEQSQSPIPGETAQGLLGVGYSIAQGGQYPTLIDDLASEGLINRRAFSLYLNDANSGDGTILFGGIDKDKYTGDLVALPVVPDIINGQGVYYRYLVDLTSVSLVDLSSGGATAKLSPPDMATGSLLDSGTTQTILDKTIFDNLVAGIGAVAVTVQGSELYVADCSIAKSNVAVAYQFGGSNGPVINVPIGALLTDLGGQFGNGDEACLLLARAASSAIPDTILGDSFLRNAYVYYDLDNNEISIAQAKLGSSSENIEVVPTGTVGITQAVSTATATASPFTLDNGAAATEVISSEAGSAPTNVPQSANAPTFSAVTAAGTGALGGGSSASASGSSGSGSSSTGSANAASHAGLMASTPMGMMHMGVLVSLAACVFAGMLVL